MKLTILGNNGPYPAAGGVCSGYLLQQGKIRLALDLGGGTLSNLQTLIGFEDITAIILTHLHNDHITDMMLLRYAIETNAKRGFVCAPINVYLPAEPDAEYARLAVKGVFELHPITDDTMIHLGSGSHNPGLMISFRSMKHSCPCYAVSVSDTKTGRRMVYSGDTSWNQGLIEFAHKADLLLADSCDGYSRSVTQHAETPKPNHMTAEECARTASASDAGRLLLTHFWPRDDKNLLIREARKLFKNSFASEAMRTYKV